MTMNLYGEQQNNNNWLYQPIVVELDDSSYYDEESSSTITTTSSFVSSNHTSTASIKLSSFAGPANSAPGCSNIVVRGAAPLYIPSPPCSPDPSPAYVIGGKCSETTDDQTSNEHKNHRRRRRKSQSNNYAEYHDYYLEHWISEPPRDNTELEPSSSTSSRRKAFRKRHFRKKAKGRKVEEETIRPCDTVECSQDDESEVASSCPSTGGTNTSTKMNFHDVYVLTRQIDKGAFSTVWEAIHRTSGRRYAAKLIDRRTLSPSDDKSIYREVATLRHLHNLPPFRDDDDYYHDYNSSSSNTNKSASTRHFSTASANLGIIQLIDFYVEPTHFFLVTDYVGGGDLFSRVLEKRYYDEETARELARGFFQSLFYLHSRNVVHRDIKPENLLLCSREDDVQLKIADFGFATRLRRNDPARSKRRGGEAGGVEKEEEDCKVRDKCGTPSYVAPEVLRGVPYDTQVDMWSAGVVMYFLIGGYPPFVDRKSRKGLFRKICRADYEFHETDWSDVSEDAKDFIRRLLTLCPEERMTAEEALSHHWIRGRANNKKIVSMMGPEYSVPSKISSSSTPKPQASTDTKMTASMSSATAMSSTTSTITTSHLYISNASSGKDHHPVSNRVRSARKKLSKVFKSMKDGASGSGGGSGGNSGVTATASSSHANTHHHHNHVPLRPRTGTNCSVTVASSQCDESSVEPPPPVRRPPRKMKSKVRPPPRRRTGTI